MTTYQYKATNLIAKKFDEKDITYHVMTTPEMLIIIHDITIVHYTANISFSHSPSHQQRIIFPRPDHTIKTVFHILPDIIIRISHHAECDAHTFPQFFISNFSRFP